MERPILCVRDDAWLGDGYYFWEDLEDAEYWGEISKTGTGQYSVYSCEMQTDDILDTVFNEEHYKFWLIAIERTAKTIVKRTGQKPSLKEINDYFKERAKWNDVTGIRFQDLPTNPERLLVAPIRSGTKNKHFAYRKRIQLAIFKLDIIFNFARLKNGECSTP